MSNEEQFLNAVGRASLCAGPLFFALMLLIQYQQLAPQTHSIAWHDLPPIIGASLIVIPLTVAVGACVAFPVCLVMAGILFHLANWLPLARPAALWIGAGAGAAVGIAYALFDGFGDAETVAFTGTAMACAALVRSRFHWD